MRIKALDESQEVSVLVAREMGDGRSYAFETEIWSIREVEFEAHYEESGLRPLKRLVG